MSARRDFCRKFDKFHGSRQKLLASSSKKRPNMARLVVHLEDALEKHLGYVPSVYGDNSVGSRNSTAQYNRSIESYKFQVASNHEESIISLSREGNKANKEIKKSETMVKVSQSKGMDRKITQNPLWVRSLVSLRNILKPIKNTGSDLPHALMFSELPSIRMFSLKNIKLATKDFSDKFIIGMGAFSVVYKGFIDDRTRIVAIKRFRSYTHTFCTAVELTKMFQAEVELLSTIHYVHLIPFVGLCNESNELIVVYKYMSHGTLHDNLFGKYGTRNDKTFLTWEQRLKICIGAARGLNYLHEVGVIHRDLGVENIMLDDNFVAKISDFEVSRMLSLGESGSYVCTRVMGAKGVYLDPAYFNSGRLTKATDVYSFGNVLLIVLSGRPVFQFYRCEKERHLTSLFETCFQQGNFDKLIDPNLVGINPSASLGKFVHLIKICLHELPNQRPVMAQVVVNLQESLDLMCIDNDKYVRETQSADTPIDFDQSKYLSKTTEQVKLRAEIARLRDLHTVKGDGGTKRPV